MAYITAPRHSQLRDWVAAPFRAIGSFLVMLAEAGPRSEALERLSRLSDEQLAARGTTREEEIRRIMGVGAYL